MTDNLADNYGWTTAEGRCSCDYLSPRIFEYLKKLGARRVLDLGAGNGALCAELFAAGYAVAGVECDRQGIELSRKAHPQIRFYEYGVQDDPKSLLAQEAPFDVVVATELVEHLFAPHLLPRYAAAVLRDGGHLLLTTPYHGYLKNIAIAVSGTWDRHHAPLYHGGHIKFWSRATLSELLVRNGFTVVGFSGVGRFTYLWKSMIMLARKT